MNPEAEKLRHAMSVVEIKWLQDNADTVAELVDAAMDVSWQETADNPGLVIEYEHRALRRLARAVVDFKGPPEPPEPDQDYLEILRCPEPGCEWWRRCDRDAYGQPTDGYRRHYRADHLGGKP